jgi:hypothetical protein
VAEEVREFASEDDFNLSIGRDAVIGDGYSVFEIGGRHYSNDRRRFFAPF